MVGGAHPTWTFRLRILGRPLKIIDFAARPTKEYTSVQRGDPPMTRTTAFALFFLILSPAPIARGQTIFPPVFGSAAGVYIDAEATLHQRQSDTASDLASQRLRAKALNQPPKAQDLTYVSLPRLFAEVRSLSEQKKEVPENLRYLSGITQIRYVFVYPDEHDLIIAGVSEPFDATIKTQPQ